MKRTLRQVLIALVFTLVGLELALQLVSAFGAPLFVRSSLAGSPDAITVLCVGDSHTYGAPLPEEESYPAQLQVLLEERYPSRDFSVVNLGVPGVNSHFVARRLERQLLQIRPQLLLVSAGLNNRWNDLWADQSSISAWDVARRMLLRIKLFRLAAVATETGRYVPTEGGSGRWQHPDKTEFDKQLRAKFKEMFGAQKDTAIQPSKDQIRETIEHDMRAMIETARALGVPIMWYRYPAVNDRQDLVGKIIENIAREYDVPVIQAGGSMQRAVADGYKFNDLFVNAAGPHPTGILYRYIVEDMLPTVVAQLNLEEEKTPHAATPPSSPSTREASRSGPRPAVSGPRAARPGP